MPWVWEEPIVLVHLSDETIIYHCEDRKYWFQFRDDESDTGWTSFDVRDLRVYRAAWRNKDHYDRVIKALRQVDNMARAQGKAFRQWLLDNGVELHDEEDE